MEYKGCYVVGSESELPNMSWADSNELFIGKTLDDMRDWQWDNRKKVWVEVADCVCGADRQNEIIENKFTYHAPTDEKQEKYVRLREKAKELAYMIEDMCPDSPEKNGAITRLEEASMWANASIARN